MFKKYNFSAVNGTLQSFIPELLLIPYIFKIHVNGLTKVQGGKKIHTEVMISSPRITNVFKYF
jgi:hypothetical protein